MAHQSLRPWPALAVALGLLFMVVDLPQPAPRTGIALEKPADQTVASPAPARRPSPKKTEKQGPKVPAEWIAKIHKAAPGADWQAIEAGSLRDLLRRKQTTGEARFSGTWTERGPANIPGRITDIDIDYQHGRLYCISDNGVIFQSDNLDGNNWQPLNDRFPLALGVAAQLRVFPGAPNTLVTSGYMKVDNAWNIYFSTDNGAHWSVPPGIGAYPIMGIRRLMTQGNTVYALMQEYNPAGPTDYYTVYKSANQGASFSKLYRSAVPIGDGGRHVKSDMWVPDDATNPNLYLLLEDSLFSVNKTSGARIYKGLVSGQTPDQALLTGHAVGTAVELTAYEAFGNAGKFYAWSSANQNWQYKGQLTDWWLSLPFGPNSMTCSPLSADTLYFGALITSRSTNRGANWTVIDLDPTGSYALYHGDVPKTLYRRNPNNGQTEVYMGTDGGLYRLDKAADHFNQLGVPGLNCTQIYKMVSKQSDPGQMYIGTQDNGYCYTLSGNAQPGKVDFTFLWGGDVTAMASGDGGASFWEWWLGDGCNYMKGPDGNGFDSNWAPSWQNGSVPYWEAPIWVPQQHPDQCYTAGYLNNSGGNHLIKLKAVSGGAAQSTQLPFNFEAAVGAKVSALAISPLDSNVFYAATENGYFLRSTNGGQSWQSVHLSDYFYPRAIYPSTLHPGEVWVGGSGYSNAPIYHSTNNGQSFVAFDTGLPPCLLEAFAADPAETTLFAATSIGPFACDLSGSTWTDISGADAPLAHYMDVEYIASTQTVRFATYARGVWDYSANPPFPVELLGFSARLNVQNAVDLDWQTASETGNSHFIVQRSADGLSFAKLDSVPAQGNANTLQAYHAQDPHPLSGTSYYRLKQVDLSGKSTLSALALIRLGGAAEPVAVYPNPAGATLRLRGATAPEQGYEILNSAGRPVASGRVDAQGRIDVSRLPAGAYYLRLDGMEGRVLAWVKG